VTREEAIYTLKNAAWLGTHEERVETEQAIDMAIEALNSVTDSENGAVESKNDVIKRQDAIKTVIRMCSPICDWELEKKAYTDCVIDEINSLPSATCDDCIWHTCNYNKVDWDGEEGYISRRDVVNEIHKYFVEEIDKTPTEIDEDGDELYADMPTVNSLLACNKELSKRIKSLPSAEPKTGEWVLDPNGMDWSIPAWRCSECGFVANYIGVEANGLGNNPMNWAGSKFCPQCGARITGYER
jgi:hypothetical protein